MILCRTALLLLLISAFDVLSQDVKWPDVLFTMPEQESPDSNGFKIITSQSVKENKAISKEQLLLQRNDSLLYFTQSILYQLEYDYFTQTAFFQKEKNISQFGAQDNYFDLSGKINRHNFPVRSSSIGLSWTPVGTIKNLNGNRSLQGWTDVGPEIGYAPLGIPILVNGGVSGYLSNNNMHTNSFTTFEEGTKSDLGYFGMFTIGNYDKAIAPFLPLHISSSIYGRDVGSSRKILYKGSALFAQDLSTGDSIFIYYDDAYSDGQNTFLGNHDEKIFNFVSTRRRIGRNVQFMSGLKGKPLFQTAPSLVYSNTVYTSVTPVNSISDEKKTNNALMFILSTVPDAPLTYNGGLRMETEDYNRTLEYENYYGLISAMHNEISKFYPDSTGIQYAFDISRKSKTFTYKKITENDTIRNTDDNDRIVQHHQLQIVPAASSIFKTTVSGEYFKNIYNYIRKEKSSESEFVDLYRLGGALNLRLLDNLTINENVTADAKVSEYKYPQFHLVDRAPYSRRFISKLTSEYLFSPVNSLYCAWSETYRDDGYWVGEKLSNPKGYYAIQNKTWYHELELNTSAKYSKIMCELGSNFKYINSYTFTKQDMELSSTFTVIPYCKLVGNFGDRYNVNFILKRFIDSFENDYWDFTLSVQALW